MTVESRSVRHHRNPQVTCMRIKSFYAEFCGPLGECREWDGRPAIMLYVLTDDSEVSSHSLPEAVFFTDCAEFFIIKSLAQDFRTINEIADPEKQVTI